MSNRHESGKRPGGETFRSDYDGKREPTVFCKLCSIPAFGGKKERTQRIDCDLTTEEVLREKTARRTSAPFGEMSERMYMEQSFICSGQHRAFFAAKMGKTFTASVPFQKRLKENGGKIYAQGIEAYAQPAKARENEEIGTQFESNAYVRDFFAHRQGKALASAIKCRRYKKNLRGHSRYRDLSALSSP